MIFETRVHGIPCQCEVTACSPARPMRITGSGFGDADPPELGDFEFRILDRQGRHAPWLEKYLKPEDTQRFLKELER